MGGRPSPTILNREFSKCMESDSNFWYSSDKFCSTADVRTGGRKVLDTILSGILNLFQWMLNSRIQFIILSGFGRNWRAKEKRYSNISREKAIYNKNTVFRPSVIKYRLSKGSVVILEVFDMMWKKLYTEKLAQQRKQKHVKRKHTTNNIQTFRHQLLIDITL